MKFFFKVICIIMSVLTFACTNDIKETNGKPSMINSLIDFGEAEYFTGVIGQTILFDVDNTDLNESARYILTSQAVWLIENNKYTIIINGYYVRAFLYFSLSSFSLFLGVYFITPCLQ